MSTTTVPNPLKFVCPRCKAGVDEACKSKNGEVTKTIHRPRIALSLGQEPAKPGRKPGRTVRTSATPKVTVKGVNSATIGAFMDDLEKLRNEWHLNEPTMIAVVDPETGVPMAATYDQGAWLVTMGTN